MARRIRPENTSQKPKLIREVPSWFDASRYNDPALLSSARDWLSELGPRLAVCRQLESIELRDRLRKREGRMNYAQAIGHAYLNRLKRHPLEHGVPGGHAMFSMTTVPAVTSSSEWDVLRLAAGISKESHELFSKLAEQPGWNSRYWSDREKLETSLSSRVVNPLITKLQAYVATLVAPVMVNLGAQDRQIISGFRDWLAKERGALAKQQRSHPYTKVTFHAWRKAGVLPFMDLRIWELSEGVRISRTAVARALFGPRKSSTTAATRPRNRTKLRAEPNYRARFQKTTVKYIKHIFSVDVLENLAALVASGLDTG